MRLSIAVLIRQKRILDRISLSALFLLIFPVPKTIGTVYVSPMPQEFSAPVYRVYEEAVEAIEIPYRETDIDAVLHTQPGETIEIPGFEVEASGQHSPDFSEMVQPEISSAQDSLALSWKPADFFRSVQFGIYVTDIEDKDETPHQRQFRTWLKKEAIPYSPRITAEDSRDKDFYLNLDTSMKLSDQSIFRTGYFWSHTSFPVDDAMDASYDYTGINNRIDYQFSEYLSGGLGYEFNYAQYSQDEYLQQTLGYVPNADITLTPFKGLGLLDSFSIKASGEIRNARYEDDYGSEVASRNETKGVSMRWKVAGFQMDPGVSFRNEVADLNQPEPEDYVQRFIRVSRHQKIGFLTAKPYVSWSSETKQSAKSSKPEREQLALGADLDIARDLTLRQTYKIRKGKPYAHETEPKMAEVAAELRYRILGADTNVFLVRVGYEDDFERKNAVSKERSEAHANAAFKVKF